MVITQDELINQIADYDGMDADDIRNVMKTAEQVIMNHMRSVSKDNNVVVKVFSGIKIKGRYINAYKCDKGAFANVESTEHVKVRADVTKYYNTKVNEGLF